VRIEDLDGALGRGFAIRPGELRDRIVIDDIPGFDLDQLPRFRHLPRGTKALTWFVCPTDKTTLRVPEDAAGKEFTCPVDGTKMEKRKGHGFQLFIDEERKDGDV
jgi:hypothetical protein